MIVNPEVIAAAKIAFFPNLPEMPNNVIEGFIAWCKDFNHNPEEDTELNRKTMYNMAQWARATWTF